MGQICLKTICVTWSYASTSTYMQKESQWHNDKGREKTSLTKICTSHFIVRVWKGLLKVLLWEGTGDRTELQYIDPHSYGRQCCVFLVLQGCSTGGPGAQLSAERWLSLPHLVTNGSPKLHQGSHEPLQPGMPFPTTSYQQLLWTPTQLGPPRAPSARCGFPYHISSLTPTVWFSVLTELYNSSMPTQSPTQSLEWHVWSSSSGNNCHRSLSSSASVYECTMGILPCLTLLAKSTYANSPHQCHRNVSLPSGASLWNGIFGRVEGQNTTIIR